MLLHIEEHLQMMHHREDCVQLLEKLSTDARKWLSETKDKHFDDSEYARWWSGPYFKNERRRLMVMWDRKDSVWLLETGLLHHGYDIHLRERTSEGKPLILQKFEERLQWCFLRKIHDILKMMHSPNIPSEQYQQTPAGREQLLVTFQARLHQWINRTVSLRHQHWDLEYMLKYWPRHREVRTHCVRNYQSQILQW